MVATVVPFSALAAGSHTVTFTAASSSFDYYQVDTAGAYVLDGSGNKVSLPAYRFAMTYDDKGYLDAKGLDPNGRYRTAVSGGIEYEIDASGRYLYDSSTREYELADNTNEYSADSVRYSPIYLDSTVTSSETSYGFAVILGEAYQASSLIVEAVTVDGTVILPKLSTGGYAVQLNGDVTIRVREYENSNTGDNKGGLVLLKKFFPIPLASGEGYKLKTADGSNYKAAQYGGDFTFKVVIDSDYNADNAIVTATRIETGANNSSSEVLTSYGIDSSGNKLYKITNVTTLCSINVSLVLSSKDANIFQWFKRIIRLILSLFGISFDNQFTKSFSVKINSSGQGYSYSIISGVPEQDMNSDSVTVLHGDSIVIKLVTSAENEGAITVSWTPGNETGTTFTPSDWTAVEGDTTGGKYYRLYCLDGIEADTVVTITGPVGG